MQWRPVVLALSAGYLCSLGSAYAQDSAYQSPYDVVFSVPAEELFQIDSSPPRNDFRNESDTPYEDWYSRRSRQKFGSWGPLPRHYPAVPDFERLPATWKRQRVLAVAYRMVGLPYQHHHLPDWDPPHDWPWKPVAFGRNSKGMDCSDFT